MKISFSLLPLIISIFWLTSCVNKKDELYIQKKPVDVQMDSVARWLKNENNFFKYNYEDVFNNYYEDKIKNKNFQVAMATLKNVSENAIRLNSFKKPFRDKIAFFSNNYRSKIANQNELLFLNMHLGKYYMDKSEFEKAILFFSLGTKQQIVDFETCNTAATSFYYIAFCNFCLGQQDLAIQNNLKALELFKKTDRTDALGGIYSNLYAIYLATKDYKNAEKYLNKSSYYLKLNKEKNLMNIYNMLFNKFQLYDETNQLEKRRLLTDSTLAAFKKSNLNDLSVKISLYLMDFTVKLEDGNLNAADKILNSIKSDVNVLNSDYTTDEYNIALALLEIKKIGIKNTKLITDAIPTLMEKRDFQSVQSAYTILYEDAIKKKQFKNALEYYGQYQQASDSLGNQIMAQKVMELKTKYETEKKEQQIELQEKTILNKNTTIALLASLFIGMLLIIIVYVIRQKQKKLKVEKQNAQLYTKQLLEKTEEERKRIASDLHDSVSHELLSLKNSFEEKTESTNTKIDAIINDIRIISRNLHPVMFDKIGLKDSIEQLVERTQSVNDFMVTAEVEYAKKLTNSEELQLYRIIQEALSNIIKYANAIAAKITIIEKNNSIFIEIKDNGKGFNVSEKLNGKNAFGLHNIIERSRAIGGEAKIQSDTNGTILTIEIKNK